MARTDAIVLYDYRDLGRGAIKGRLGRERKDGTRGRARMSVEIVSEPITTVFDELVLGRGPADAIAETLKEKLANTSLKPTPRTLETRRYQEAAYKRGETWAKQRFGFRGASHPISFRSDDRIGNFSGTLRNSIVATENRTEKSWTVNVAANRLDPRTSRNAGEFQRMLGRLIEAVPELGDPARLANDPKVKAAIAASIEDMIMTARQLNQKLREEKLRAILGALGIDQIPGVDLALELHGG